jgi:hypothetical protein
VIGNGAYILYIYIKGGIVQTRLMIPAKLKIEKIEQIVQTKIVDVPQNDYILYVEDEPSH